MTRDATAVWNPRLETFELGTVFDEWWCSACGRESSEAVWVDVEDADGPAADRG